MDGRLFPIPTLPRKRIKLATESAGGGDAMSPQLAPGGKRQEEGVVDLRLSSDPCMANSECFTVSLTLGLDASKSTWIIGDSRSPIMLVFIVNNGDGPRKTFPNIKGDYYSPK